MAYFDYNGKQVFYTVLGSGSPCLFLHGNTASSKMFEPILPLYTAGMQVILMDFLGNGQSERIPRFPDELWIDQGRQIAALCRVLDCGKVNLVGTSGGAYAAVNAALEYPELFRRVVADSFTGDILPEGFAAAILAEWAAAKGDTLARGFYEWNQGADWERVVDLDTEALVNYERKGTRLFSRPLETLQVPLLMTISREDEMLMPEMDTVCRRLSGSNPLIRCKLYDTGAHPLICSRAEEIAPVIQDFLTQESFYA